MKRMLHNITALQNGPLIEHMQKNVISLWAKLKGLMVLTSSLFTPISSTLRTPWFITVHASIYKVTFIRTAIKCKC